MSHNDVVTLHAQSVELFLDRVRAVPEERWSRATPCSAWDVRELVNHVVGGGPLDGTVDGRADDR